MKEKDKAAGDGNSGQLTTLQSENTSCSIKDR